MLQRKCYLAFIITLFLTLNITAQWYWQNPKPQGNPLKDIILVDNTKLAAIGFGGVFLLSTNNGDSWAISYIADDIIWATDIFYTEQNHTFYTIGRGFNGMKLYSSINDGQEWQTIYSFNEGIGDVYVFDENNWIAVGSNGKIKRTTDAGATWNDLPAVVTTSTLNSIKFIDNQVGLIVGSNGVILRSTDSGDSWSLVPSGTTERLLKVEFYNSQIAVAVGDYNTILKTTDGGVTWDHQTYTGVNPYSILLDVSIIDEQNYVAVGGDDDFYGGRESLVIRSSDGGNSWTEISDQFTRGLSGIAFVNSNSGFAVGYSGGIYKTEDSGFNWSRISSGDYYHFCDLYTMDSSTFYITGLDHSYLFTNNGGVTWQTVSTPDFSSSGIAFIDKDYGILTADSSVYKTTNGGNDWNLIYSGSATYFTDVAILNYETIIIIDDLGGIFKTTNSGVSWYPVNSGITSSLAEIVFKDSMNGLIIANDFLAMITNDGGETWTIINYNFWSLHSVEFFGSSGIAISASGGKIFISKDNGLSWEEKVVTYPNYYISSIAFKDSLNGTAVGETGIMFNTTDGGENWQAQFSPTLIDFLKIKYSKNGNGIILGKEGVILGSKSGVITRLELNETFASPEEFYLSQNFPNPYNSSTKIQFTINSIKLVSLKVFDLLGREVATLVNEEKPVGTYEVNWNAVNLPSGVYFYRLQAGSFVQTRKMILLK